MTDYSVCIKNLSLTPDSSILFPEAHFKLLEGHLYAFTGDNGAGKTVLSYVLAQFAPFLIHHSLVGKLLYNGTKTDERAARKFWKKINYTFQDPDAQYTELRVRDELWRVLNEKQKFDELVARYNLEHLLERSFFQISYGERQRILWARDYSAGKDLYILDEVGSYLDGYWQSVLASDTRRLADSGKIVVILGHLGVAFEGVSYENHLVERGEIRKIVKKINHAPPKLSFSTGDTWGDVIARIYPFKITRDRQIIEFPIELILRQGEVAVLLGKNGVGKTTLLSAIAGIGLNWFVHRKLKTRVIVNKPRYVMQNPYTQTFESTVGELLSGIKENYLIDFSWIKGLDPKRDPLSLSYGEQKVLHILNALHSDADLILIDEFMTGLTKKTIRQVAANIMVACNNGKAVILTAHPEADAYLAAPYKINL